MAYNDIGTYAKPHGSGSNSNDGRVIQIINKGGANGFDPKYVNINTLDAHNANIDNLTATNVNIDNADFVYLVSQNGIIQKLQGSELTYDNGRINKLQSDEIETNKLSVKEEANIKNLIADYIQSNSITTDYLTVNKSAHFFELVIDKIRSVQGTQMNTAANCVADYVEWYDADDNLTDDINEVYYFRVYWRSTDDDGRAITNDWLPRDQALCESFNIGTGQHDNTQNKYYWRYVQNTSSDAGESIRYIDFDNDDVREVQPLAFTITLTNIEYGDAIDHTHNFTNFIITPQILGQWNSSTQTWTPTSTLYGLQLTKANNDGIVLTGGKFMLNTSSPTKLNIGLYYDDGTYEYFPCSGYTSSYLIISQDNKNIEAIIINTAVINKWEPCNWIDLSNIDCDTNTKNAIPTAGDNIVQLGYRYNELSNPTQDDIQRASAIIISAYQTPDSGVYPPSYAQYQNIIDYSLSNHRKTFFDSRQARFVGDFTIQSTGQDIEQYIDDVVNGKTGTIHLDLQKHMVGTVHEFIIPSDTNLTTSTFTNLQGLYFYLYDTNGNRIFPNDPDWDYSNDRTFVVLDGRQFTISGYNSNTVTVDGITMAYGMNSDAMTISFSGNPITWRNENTNMQIMVRYNGNDYMLTIPIYVYKTQEGTDGELWRLSPVKELAYVDTNMSFNYDIGYKVQHLVGDQSHYYTNDLPSDYKLRAYTYDNLGAQIGGYIELNSSAYNTNGMWSDADQDTSWSANKETYIVIQLLKNGDIIDARTIDVIMETTGYVNETNGHTTLIQANTNSISSLEQTVTGIQATVSNHTNQINQNTTNIGQLSITTGQINLGLQEVTQTTNGIDTWMRNTGINIEPGKITLDAEKTNITGDLDLRGTFTSENDDTMNKILIDTDSGGISLYGPSNVTDEGEPSEYATQEKIIDMGFGTDPDALTRYGYLILKEGSSNTEHLLIEPQLLEIQDDYHRLGISNTSVACDNNHIDWEQLINRKLRIVDPNSATYTMRIDDDGLTSTYNGDMTITLPTPSQELIGKYYIFKHIANRNTYIQSIGNVMINKGSYTTTNSLNIGYTTTTVLCDGEYWILN